MRLSMVEQYREAGFYWIESCETLAEAHELAADWRESRESARIVVLTEQVEDRFVGRITEYGIYGRDW